MKLLAIDTSTKYLSLAIADDNELLAKFHEHQDMKHSSLLIPMIDKLLKKCHLTLKNIDAIALSIGPGSFTGLRIGVATCKGINMALGTPIIAVPTLDVIAYNFIHETEDLLCPLIDAKKKKVYTCFYRKPSPNRAGSETVKLKRLTEYMLTDVDNLLKIVNMINKSTLIFGDAVGLYGDYCKRNSFVNISTKDWVPKAEVIVRLGLAKTLKREYRDPEKLVPIYLHSKYCQVTVNDK